MTQVDYFLKIEGVDGESKDARHTGEMELASFNWGETNSGSGGDQGGAGVGRTVAQNMLFAKRVDRASPKLFIACATGEHFKKAVLVGRKATAEQQEFLRLTLDDVSVSSYQLGGDANSGTPPMDQVALRFAKLEVSYKAQKADGSLDAEIKQKYNFATHRRE